MKRLVLPLSLSHPSTRILRARQLAFTWTKQSRIVFWAALGILALAACTSDEAVETGNKGEALTGEETYVTFNFNVQGKQATSRGAMETADGKVDNVLSDGRILIYDEAAGTLINNQSFTLTGANTSITIKTSPGIRRIYILAGAEGKTQMTDRLSAPNMVGNTAKLADFYNLMTDGQHTAGAADTDMGAGFKELMESRKFVMSNVADADAVKTIGAGANTFSFKVLRAVAKGKLTASLINQGTPTTADGVFTLKKDVTYGVRNINRGTLYVQQFGNDKLPAPADNLPAASNPRPLAAFYHVFDATSADNLKKPDTYKPYYFGGYDIKGADAAHMTLGYGTTAGTPGPFVYFSENSNNKPLRGNTTYYGITTQVASIAKDKIAGSFTYDSALKQIKTTPATADYQNTAGNQSFWYLRELPAKIIDMLVPPARRAFTNEASAFRAMTVVLQQTPIALTSAGFTNNNYTADKLQKAYHATGTGALNAADKATVDRYLGYYANGYSYYRVNIYELTTPDDTKRCLVRRNYSYEANIASFATLGAPTEADLDKDPEKPVDTDNTNVTVTFHVIGWQNVPMHEDL